MTVTNLTNYAVTWELNGVAQTDITANGTATFVMIDGDVAVTGNAISPHAINGIKSNIIAYASYADGTLSNPITEAVEGTTVYVSHPPYWSCLSPNPHQHISDTVDSFTMPAYDVTLSYMR